MSCLDCSRADFCHSERKKDIADLAEGVKHIINGYTLVGIEELELLQTRMERRSLSLTERDLNQPTGEERV